MSHSAMEPTRVIPPRSPTPQGGSQRNFYQPYNTRTVGGNAEGPSSTPGFDYSGSRVHGLFQRAPQGPMTVNMPKGVPRFLGARPVLFFGWAVAMILVALDEWHTYHILPRPARLWYTSLFFFILGGVSVVDSLVPIVNLFAIGMIVVLAYQYYYAPKSFETPQATEGPANG